MKRHECDSFLRGYLDAALFTTDLHPPSGQEYVESGRADEMFLRIPDWFITKAQRDCAQFQAENAALLSQAGDDCQNGADFYYTRNGHGCGFWDRGYAEAISEPLTKAAHSFGEADLMPEDIGQEERMTAEEHNRFPRGRWS